MRLFDFQVNLYPIIPIKHYSLINLIIISVLQFSILLFLFQLRELQFLFQAIKFLNQAPTILFQFFSILHQASKVLSQATLIISIILKVSLPTFSILLGSK